MTDTVELRRWAFQQTTIGDDVEKRIKQANTIILWIEGGISHEAQRDTVGGPAVRPMTDLTPQGGEYPLQVEIPVEVQIETEKGFWRAGAAGYCSRDEAALFPFGEALNAVQDLGPEKRAKLWEPGRSEPVWRYKATGDEPPETKEGQHIITQDATDGEDGVSVDETPQEPETATGEPGEAEILAKQAKRPGLKLAPREYGPLMDPCHWELDGCNEPQSETLSDDGDEGNGCAVDPELKDALQSVKT